MAVMMLVLISPVSAYADYDTPVEPIDPEDYQVRYISVNHTTSSTHNIGNGINVTIKLKVTVSGYLEKDTSTGQIISYPTSWLCSVICNRDQNGGYISNVSFTDHGTYITCSYDFWMTWEDNYTVSGSDSFNFS